jgi:hypothetical protein
LALVTFDTVLEGLFLLLDVLNLLLLIFAEVVKTNWTICNDVSDIDIVLRTVIILGSAPSLTGSLGFWPNLWNSSAVGASAKSWPTSL